MSNLLRTLLFLMLLAQFAQVVHTYEHDIPDHQNIECQACAQHLKAKVFLSADTALFASYHAGHDGIDTPVTLHPTTRRSVPRNKSPPLT